MCAVLNLSLRFSKESRSVSGPIGAAREFLGVGTGRAGQRN